MADKIDQIAAAVVADIEKSKIWPDVFVPCRLVAQALRDQYAKGRAETAQEGAKDATTYLSRNPRSNCQCYLTRPDVCHHCQAILDAFTAGCGAGRAEAEQAIKDALTMLDRERAEAEARIKGLEAENKQFRFIKESELYESYKRGVERGRAEAGKP